MQKAITTLAVLGLFVGGTVQAGQNPGQNQGENSAKDRMRHELTAGISMAGAHALHHLQREQLQALPSGFPIRQQMQQLRAARRAQLASKQL